MGIGERGDMIDSEATTPVQKIGKSSLALIIPSPIVKDLDLKKHDFMKVRMIGGCIIYERIQ